MKAICVKLGTLGIVFGTGILEWDVGPETSELV